MLVSAIVVSPLWVVVVTPASETHDGLVYHRRFYTTTGDTTKVDQQKAIELLKRPDVTAALRIAVGQLRQGIIEQDKKGE